MAQPRHQQRTLKNRRNPMKNVDIQVKDGKLILTIDLSKQFGLSVSGKSRIIASTEGKVGIPGREDVKVAINIYQKV
jgi:hypothetical protein